MKNFPGRLSRAAAFTLIELLVVIAVIVILAAMLFPIMNRVSVTQAKAVTKAQFHQIDTAIKAYQAKYSFYPPDNPLSARTNALYYELAGTIRTNLNNDPTQPAYRTLDGTEQILSNTVFAAFRVPGFANSSASVRGGDEQGAAVNFLKDVKPDQIGNLAGARVLVCTTGGDTIGALNSPWRYNSSNPTNNPTSYDLWVDVYIGGKPLRFSNWNTEPQLAQ